MAREIYLLGCDPSAEPEEVSKTIDTWSKKLGKLGVGSLENVRPIIFRLKSKPHAKAAATLFTALNAEAIYNLDNLVEQWTVPFRSRHEAATCLAAISHYTVTKGEVPARYQQRIIIGDKELSEDFMRLNPDGLFAEVGNIEAGEPSYTYVYRAVSANPRTRQR